MKFNNGKEMYDYLQNSGDLYCEASETYVFMYNEAGALCYYHVSPEEAKELSVKAREMEDYWGAFLGTGGCILDKEEPEGTGECILNKEESEYSIKPSFDFCDEQFNKDWIPTSDY